MAKVTIKELAYAQEPLDIHWHVGLIPNADQQWMIRTVTRGVQSGRMTMTPLPIGLLPLLPLGVRVEAGNLCLHRLGEVGEVLIANTAEAHEVGSDKLPQGLYDFQGRSLGRQRLFLFETRGNRLFVPATELVRYLLLHNVVLANHLMVPSGLMTLFRPMPLVDDYEELRLDFTSAMPKVVLNDSFVQEFAWLAVHPEGRKVWDSVRQRSYGQDYVSLELPLLHDSLWRYRGTSAQGCTLVLELLHISGRRLPCQELVYSHPELKQPVRRYRRKSGSGGSGTDGVTDAHISGGVRGTRMPQNTLLEMPTKRFSFEHKVDVTPIWQDETGSGVRVLSQAQGDGVSGEAVSATELSVAPMSAEGGFTPIEFALLQQVEREDFGVLEPMVRALRQLSALMPNTCFQMGLCMLKQGRVFSLAESMPRVCLVTVITVPVYLPVVLLDVDRADNRSVSTLLLRYHDMSVVQDMECHIQQLLDALVDNSGRWGVEAEAALLPACECIRLRNLIPEREKERSEEDILELALRLRERMGLG